MALDHKIAGELILLLQKIEEDAAVDFLGTGSNSKLADQEEQAWRQLFVQAKELITKGTKDGP